MTPHQKYEKSRSTLSHESGGDTDDLHSDPPEDAYELLNAIPEENADVRPEWKSYTTAYNAGILIAISSREYTLLCRSDASQRYLDGFIDAYAAAYAEQVLRKRGQWPPSDLPPS